MKLDQARIQSALLCGEAFVFEEVDSTNLYLFRNAKILPSGSICLAEAQTAGYGRRGRAWYSPKGENIYFSLLWKYETINPANFSALTLMISTIIAETFEELGIPDIQIKWPNDVYHQGKKCVGISTETRMDSEGCHLVIGIGINLGMSEVDETVVTQPWADLSHYHLDRNAFVAMLAPNLQKNLKIYPLVGFEHYLERWQRFDIFADKAVKLISDTNEIHGISRGINAKGELLLEQDGKITAFAMGEMSLRAQ